MYRLGCTLPAEMKTSMYMNRLCFILLAEMGNGEIHVHLEVMLHLFSMEGEVYVHVKVVLLLVSRDGEVVMER